MFLRKQFEGKEVTINTDLIWKIETEYAEHVDGIDWSVDVATGVADPTTTKWYRVFIGNEIYSVRAGSGPLSDEIATIDKKAKQV